MQPETNATNIGKKSTIDVPIPHDSLAEARSWYRLKAAHAPNHGISRITAQADMIPAVIPEIDFLRFSSACELAYCNQLSSLGKRVCESLSLLSFILA
jgi:hypothetical protein